jgi:hypothetical protein
MGASFSVCCASTERNVIQVVDLHSQPAFSSRREFTDREIFDRQENESSFNEKRSDKTAPTIFHRKDTINIKKSVSLVHTRNFKQVEDIN